MTLQPRARLAEKDETLEYWLKIISEVFGYQKPIVILGGPELLQTKFEDTFFDTSFVNAPIDEVIRVLEGSAAHFGPDSFCFHLAMHYCDRVFVKFKSTEPSRVLNIEVKSKVKIL